MRVVGRITMSKGIKAMGSKLRTGKTEDRAGIKRVK
jgi:hypothetical protein